MVTLATPIETFSVSLGLFKNATELEKAWGLEQPTKPGEYFHIRTAEGTDTAYWRNAVLAVPQASAPPILAWRHHSVLNPAEETVHRLRDAVEWNVGLFTSLIPTLRNMETCPVFQEGFEKLGFMPGTNLSSLEIWESLQADCTRDLLFIIPGTHNAEVANLSIRLKDTRPGRHINTAASLSHALYKALDNATISVLVRTMPLN